jgi:hypothetical protein
LPLFTELPRRGVFSETRTAPVLLAQDCEVLPPPHRTGSKGAVTYAHISEVSF